MLKRGIQNKRGQVTLFIIIAIVVVAVIVLFLFLRGRTTAPEEKKFVEPKSYIQDCAKVILKDALENVSKQGGYLEPQDPYFYPYFEDDASYNVGYLCYAGAHQDQAPYCQSQMVRVLIKSELNKTWEDIESCVDSAVTNLEDRGSEVTKGNFAFDINFTKKSIDFIIRCPITVKDEETTAYENFDVSYDSNIDSFIIIAQDIVNGESNEIAFDAAGYYQNAWASVSPKVKIEVPINERINSVDKLGTIVYNVTFDETQETFLFAVKK
jgi:hypothetical protein